MPYPLPLTRTEAYLAYKAGVIQQSDLKPSLAVPRNGIDAWLAYWTGIAADYPKREDGTPHILQEEEAYIAYLCGVISEYPEECLRRVGAYLRYIISARWGRPDHPLNREELYLSLIKTQFIPSGDPSSDIVIDGTAKAAFADVKMYGDTFQQTYTGKNLLNVKDNLKTSASGLDFSFSDNKLVVSGTPTATYTNVTDKIDVDLPAGDYTLSISNTVNHRVYIYIDYEDSTTDSLCVINAGSTSRTATFAKKAVKIRLDFSYMTTGTALNESFSIQLEAGSTPSDIEPYTGGQASPNPDYPQQIQTVTGEQTVTVTGKNKINMPYRESEWNGASVLQNGTTLTMKPNSTSGISMSYSTSAIPVAIPTGETITWSRTWLGGGTWDSGAFTFPLELTYIDGTKETISLGDTTKNNYLVAASRSVTLAKDVVSVRLLNALCYSIKGMTGDIVFGVQLEYGSTATAYAPYHATNYPISLGNIELCKLGTYQDYIWKDGEDWKIHKAISKYVFDGSQDEEWIVTGNCFRPEGVAFNNIIYDPVTTNAKSNLATVWKNSTGSITVSIPNLRFGWAASGTKKLAVRFDKIKQGKPDSEALESWINILSGTPMAIYFEALSASDIIIDDADLVSQLDALVSGGAENGTTYIKVNATDPNLPGLLYVEAPKYE